MDALFLAVSLILATSAAAPARRWEAAGRRADPPPDHSRGYFTGLNRPHVNRVTMDGDGGPVILIVVDAMRPDHLSPYGARRDTTPNLSRLADEGLLFSNYYVNGNWTRPTTASLLTGLPPSRHGVERDRDRLADQYVTLAEVLSRVGVPTGAVVGNGNAGSAFGLGRGFNFYADTVKHWSGLPSAEQVVQLALPFVRQHHAQPFFLLLFFVDPHDPYHAPPPFEDMFVTEPTVPLIRSPHWELGRYSAAERERMQATYDGALRYTDTVIGNFFKELRNLGIYDKATIMVTADHGEAFGEHDVFLHAHHMYDEIIRAPLIVRAPHMSKRGGYSHYMFQTIDLLPTIAAMYKAPVQSELPGIDILSRLAKPKLNTPASSVVTEFNNFGIRRRTIRNYSQKLIYEEPADAEEFRATVGKRSLLPSVSFDAEKFQAYDLARDPYERKNIFSSKLLKAPGWARLWRLLKEHRGAGAHPPTTPVADNLDPETSADLKALGYIQ